ncbi:MAG: hypothetical protein LBQ59_05130 [Candidatus Peribacteria bacterium]|nr:hypothetical protein [Candidatus Peribacteria bacterium]
MNFLKKLLYFSKYFPLLLMNKLNDLKNDLDENLDITNPLNKKVRLSNL